MRSNPVCLFKKYIITFKYMLTIYIAYVAFNLIKTVAWNINFRGKHWSVDITVLWHQVLIKSQPEELYIFCYIQSYFYVIMIYWETHINNYSIKYNFSQSEEYWPVNIFFNIDLLGILWIVWIFPLFQSVSFYL